jgi:hypothetical protein
MSNVASVLFPIQKQNRKVTLLQVILEFYSIKYKHVDSKSIWNFERKKGNFAIFLKINVLVQNIVDLVISFI